MRLFAISRSPANGNARGPPLRRMHAAALAARGRWHRTVERLCEALEYAERPDRFLYGSDWPLAPMTAYRAFLAPLLDDPAWRPIR